MADAPRVPELDPGPPMAVGHRADDDEVATADALLRNNRLPAAEAEYTRMLADYPDDPRLHAGLGGVRRAEDRLIEARAHLERAVQLPGALPEHWALRGEVAEARDEWDDAAAAYAEAIAGRYDTAWALRLGRALTRGGRAREALPILRRVAEEDDMEPYVFTELGHALFEEGNFHGALPFYLLAQTKYPSDKAAVAGAAKTYEIVSKPAEALAAWERYQAIDCCSDFAKQHVAGRIEALKATLAASGTPPG